MKLSVLVPLFNEENTVKRCVYEIDTYLRRCDFHSELILIDDGSTDKTKAILKELAGEIPRLQLIQHGFNKGKGAAIKTGVRSAQGANIAFLDADLSTRPEMLDDALPLLDDCDLVFASRAHPDSSITKQQPGFRVFSGKLFNWYVRHSLALTYQDTQCGFKVFRRSLIPLFQEINSDGWAFDVELLYRTKHNGFTMEEIPVTWEHHHESRVKLRDVFDIYKELKRMNKHIIVPLRGAERNDSPPYS